MRVYLKIKIKSLAAEAQIIRQETRKYKGDHPARIGLYHHRVGDVRLESRSACLAYGFLRGRTYQQMEQWCHTGPDFKRIEQLVTKYGEDDPRERLQRLAEWTETATEYLRTAPKPVFEKRPKPPYVPKVAKAV